MTDIAGFGSRHVATEGVAADGEPVIQASASTGHFGVDRGHLLGAEGGDLRLRFAGIHEVSPVYGVTLTQAATLELIAKSVRGRPALTANKPLERARGWRLWRSRLQRVTTAAVDA